MKIEDNNPIPVKSDASELLKQSRIEVLPETFAVLGMSAEEWQTLLENPELSPRMTVPFMIFKDKWEVTLVLDEVDYGSIRHAVRDAKVEKGFRMLSFDAELDFDVVGYMARISDIFAVEGISILALSSFSRDHVLIRQHELARALKALRGYVAEVC